MTNIDWSLFATDPLVICEQAARAGGHVLRDWVGRFEASTKGPRDLVTQADFASQDEIRKIVLGAFPSHGFVGEEGDGNDTLLNNSTTQMRWIVDPLDGTSNYVHGFPSYCVSVALAHDDDILVGVIYDPERDECFAARSGAGATCNGEVIRVSGETDPAAALVAASFPPHVSSEAQSISDFLSVVSNVHSVRRTGSTAINLSYLACGRIDAFWVRKIACWDVAAGLLIAREAGACLGPFSGAPSVEISLERPAFIATSSSKLFHSMQKMLVSGVVS